MTTTNPTHPGGLNATQSLAFFKANGVKGVVQPCRSRRMVLATYTCAIVHLDGVARVAPTTIRAPRAAHNL